MVKLPLALSSQPDGGALDGAIPSGGGPWASVEDARKSGARSAERIVPFQMSKKRCRIDVDRYVKIDTLWDETLLGSTTREKCSRMLEMSAGGDAYGRVKRQQIGCASSFCWCNRAPAIPASKASASRYNQVVPADPACIGHGRSHSSQKRRSFPANPGS